MAAIALSRHAGERLFSQNLLVSDACDLETRHLLLELVERVGMKEDFWAAITNHRMDGINQSLKQLLFVVEQRWGEAFFECATTHKDQYYSISTLMEMIDLFHQIAPHLPKEHPPLKRFPPFDYGGKELLLKCLNNPIDLVYFLERSNSEEPRFLLPDEPQGVMKFFRKMPTHAKGDLIQHYSVEYLQNVFRVLLDVHEHCGEEMLIHFCYAPDLQNAPSLDAVVYCLQSIRAWHRSSIGLDELSNLLLAFHRNQIGFAKLLSILETKAPASRMDATESLDVLQALYQRFAGEIKDPNVAFPLPVDVLEKVRSQYEVVQSLCKKWESLHLKEWVSLAMGIVTKDEKTFDDMLKLVAIGRLAIRHEFGIYLHNTQIWAVLAQLNHSKGSIAQMITGEGKSKVATLLAFVLAMMNPSQGHVISSCRSLSIRDQMENSHFFKSFGIKTAHICEDDRDASYFQARILYGTATDFEFAVMRQMLFFEELFPPKAFDWVIVDEIDNLTIDTALSGARLSYKAEVTYDWVYVPIFSFVQAHFPIEHISNSMLDKLKSQLKEYMGGEFSRHVDCFSGKKLKGWIRAACQALKYQEKEHYIIGLQDSARGEKTKGVLIVEAENTGRIQYGSRWSGGVHEFVEVKHGLEVAKENICPISMSHAVFYPMYQSLFGITGTIGSQFEREELKALYHIDSFDVPTHHLPQRKDAPVVVLATDAQCNEYYLQAIRHCIEAGRPILVLCRSIEETESLGRQLEEQRVSFEMLNEIQQKTEQAIIDKAGFAGAVTIATNTAGRGTDIRLSEESLRNGGLHVLITFYPESDRVESQGRGRSGRQGQPGSSEIVISSEHLNMDSSDALPYLRALREQRAIGQKDIHITYAEIERSAFNMVQEFYGMLRVFHELAIGEPFLNALSTFFGNRKFLRQKKCDFSYLSPKDRRIGEMVLQLLNSPQNMTMHWKTLIQKLVERMESHIINEFSLNFHSLISETIQASGLISDLDIANRFKELSRQGAQSEVGDFSAFLEEILRASSAEKLASLQAELQASFVEQKQVWESYLDLSEQGILRYLKDQFHIDLKQFHS